MIRNLLGSLIGSVFGLWISGFVISGLRTGRIRHTDSTSTYSFRTQPLRFCLVVVVFTAFASMFFYFAARSAFDAWRSLTA